MPDVKKALQTRNEIIAARDAADFARFARNDVCFGFCLAWMDAFNAPPLSVSLAPNVTRKTTVATDLG